MRGNSVSPTDLNQKIKSNQPTFWATFPACIAMVLSMLLLISSKTATTQSITIPQHNIANQNISPSQKRVHSLNITEYREPDIKRLDYSEWGGPDMIAAIERTAQSDQPVMIDLTWSPIDDEVLQSLRKVDNLRGLFLFGTTISDHDVQELRNFTKLELLNVGTTNLSIKGILAFSNSQNLKILFVSSLHSPLSDTDISRIVETWPELEDLDLTNSNLTDKGLIEIGKLNNLKKLSARRTKITDQGMKSLASLKNLEILHLDYCQISDQGIQHLEKLRRLEKLNINKTQVTNTGLAQIAKLPELKRIYVVGTKVNDRAIPILKKQKGLEYIAGDFSEAGEAELKAALPLYRANKGG